MIDIGWLEAIATALALFLGATIVSAIGFGIGMVATPIMLLVHDPQTAIIVVATSGVWIGIWIIAKSWRDIPFREIIPISVAGALGVPISIIILKNANSNVLVIGITALIIFFAVASFFKFERELPYSKPLGILIGFIVGVLLPTSGVAGSLLMLFLLTRKWQRQTVRAGMVFFLMILTIFAVIGYAVGDLYTSQRLTLIGIAAVPSIIGLMLGAMIIGRINENVFRYVVIGVIILSCIAVLAQEFVSL